jgi:hypothetical protein
MYPQQAAALFVRRPHADVPLTLTDVNVPVGGVIVDRILALPQHTIEPSVLTPQSTPFWPVLTMLKVPAGGGPYGLSQQVIVPSVATAQVSPVPAPTVAKGPMCDPAMDMPVEFSPQQMTTPSFLTAHV